MVATSPGWSASLPKVASAVRRTTPPCARSAATVARLPPSRSPLVETVAGPGVEAE